MWKFSLEGFVYRRTTIINPILHLQCKKRFVLPSTACKLIHPCPKTSNFYMLPKIYEEICPGRPIVSTYDSPTVYISKFLDIILSPLAKKLPSFKKDTPRFLQITNDLEFPANANHKPLLFTMDFTSLYTSIPHDGALKASKHFLDKRSNQSNKSNKWDLVSLAYS